MITVEVNPDVAVEEWRAYVESHSEGTYFHLPEWQAVIRESLGHKPAYVFARNEAGRLCGILPLFQIRSALTGNRLVSLPFANACGPIAESDDTIEALVNRAKSLRDDLKCRYLELRMMRPLPLGLSVNEYYVNHMIRLSEPSAMWKRLDHGARGAVTKARKLGVVVKVDNSTDGLQAFYRLNMKNKRGLGVPAHPRGFFEAVQKYMNNRCRLYLAEVQGKAIAGAIVISFNGVVAYCYAASDGDYLQYHPNHALTWQAIEDSSRAGYRCIDYGKATPDNVGLAQYKRKFGAEEGKLHYYYYPKVPNLVSSNRVGMRYRLIAGLWKRLPLPMLEALGPVVFRQLD